MGRKERCTGNSSGSEPIGRNDDRSDAPPIEDLARALLEVALTVYLKACRHGDLLKILDRVAGRLQRLGFEDGAIPVGHRRARRDPSEYRSKPRSPRD